MVEKQNSLECNVICWGIAAFVGFIAMVMLYALADFSVLQAIFVGGLVGTLLGVVLSLFVCSSQKAASDLNAGEKPAQRYARQAAEDKARREGTPAPVAPAANTSSAPAAAAATESAASASAAAGSEAASAGGADASSSSDAAAASAPASLMAAPVKPSAPLAGEAELASRKGDWKYEAEGSDAAAQPAASAAAPVTESAASEAPAETEAAPVAADGKPKLYDAAPAEGADDLKLISGVGPKLEETLNDMGIYRFEQVAAWRAAEIAWVDDRLRFKGRIERDDWMSQAKTLAAGGETEFSQRKKK